MSEDASGIKIAPQGPHRITKMAGLLSAGSLLSKFLGLFRDLVISSLFPREWTDAWAAAFRLPHFFRRLLGEGFLQALIQPKLGGLSKEESQALLRKSFLQWGLVLTALVLVLWFFSNGLMELFLAKQGSVSVAKTQQLFLTMLPFVWFMGMMSFLLVVALWLGRLVWLAASPVLFNLVLLLFLFSSKDPHWVLGWSISVAGLVQLAVAAPLLAALGPGWQASLREVKSDLTELLRALSGGVGSIGLPQLFGLGSLYFASGLGVGAASHFFWADRLLEFPLSLVSTSLGLASIAHLSEAHQSQNHEQRRLLLEVLFVQNFKWIVPASLGLYLAAPEIVYILFYRGEFANPDWAQMSKILLYFAPLLFMMGLSRGLTWVGEAHQRKNLGRAALAAFVFFMAGGVLLQNLKFWSLEILLVWLNTSFFVYILTLAVLVGESELYKIITSSLAKTFLPASLMTGFLLLAKDFKGTSVVGIGLWLVLAAVFYLLIWKIQEILKKRRIPRRGTLG